jgi:hemerythrin-like domain-containing protein
MQALDELQHEHEAIGRVLSVLEGQVGRAEHGNRLNPSVLRGSLEFLRGFADRCHHGKEETGLFPLLAAKDAVLETGPVKILSGEHEAGRHLLRELEAAIPGIEAGDPHAARDACRAAALYTRMLRRHIEKENAILFNLARTLLTDEDADQLARHFTEVEERMGPDAHTRYEALIRELEAAVA